MRQMMVLWKKDSSLVEVPITITEAIEVPQESLDCPSHLNSVGRSIGSTRKIERHFVGLYDLFSSFQPT